VGQCTHFTSFGWRPFETNSTRMFRRISPACAQILGKYLYSTPRVKKNLIYCKHRRINQDSKISFACKGLRTLLLRRAAPPCLLTAGYFSELSLLWRIVSPNFRCFRRRVISRNFHGRADSEYAINREYQICSFTIIVVHVSGRVNVRYDINVFRYEFLTECPECVSIISGTGIHRSQNEHQEIILRLIERRQCGNFSVWSLEILAKI